MKKTLLFLLIIVSNKTFSQCDKEETINFDGGDIYVGCLNDRGVQDGFGTYTVSDGSKLYEGNWKNGNFEGEGKYYFSDGAVASGNFKDGLLNYGTYYFENEEVTIEYIGDFGENFKYKGDGIYTRITKEYTEVKKGKFINDDLLNGQSTTKFEDGLIVTEEIEMAEVVSTLRNDRNYYNVDDVEGNSEFTEIILDEKGNANDGISYDITLKINDIEGDWIFDTGAQSFTIGKRMFERLKENGMTYKDLNMDVKTIGVGGISDGELIIIDEIVVGDYKVKNVVTKVNLDNDYSLLGMMFLVKFKEVEWSMKNNTLRLYK